MTRNILAICISSIAVIGQTQKLIVPPDPEEMAKRAEVGRLIEDARARAKKGEIEAALRLLDQASTIEVTLNAFLTIAKYRSAQLLAETGRDLQAMESFKSAFRWNPAKQDLDCGAGGLKAAMEYAIVLNRSGKTLEAKAMYHYGLRQLNELGARGLEPVAFVTVFDPDPNGRYLEYTPQRLEAAALMILALNGGSSSLAGGLWPPQDLVKRANELAPDWFYPVMWEAAGGWNQEWGPERLAQAEALANPLEKEFIERYKVELAEYIEINRRRNTPDAPGDDRPMKEGATRRARMQVLRPNPEILRSLASG